MGGVLYILCLLLAAAGLPIAYRIGHPDASTDEMAGAIFAGLFIAAASIVGWLFHSEGWIIAGGVLGGLFVAGGLAERKSRALAGEGFPNETASPVNWRGEVEADLDGPVNSVTPLRFDYVDSNGECSTREVVNWVDTRFYVKGVCTTRHATRTFRKDQIELWHGGQQALRHGVLPFGRTSF